MKRSEYMPYLNTLRRIPDEAILDMATRDMDLTRGDSCLCGWAIREALCNGIPAEEVNVGRAVDPIFGWPTSWEYTVYMAQRFGGTNAEWDAIFHGVVEPREAPRIETAFTLRVMEAAGV